MGRFSPFSGPTAGLGIVGGTRTSIGQPVPDHIGPGPHGCAIAPEGGTNHALFETVEREMAQRHVVCNAQTGRLNASRLACVVRCAWLPPAAHTTKHTRTVGAGWPLYLLFFTGRSVMLASGLPSRLGPEHWLRRRHQGWAGQLAPTGQRDSIANHTHHDCQFMHQQWLTGSRSICDPAHQTGASARFEDQPKQRMLCRTGKPLSSHSIRALDLLGFGLSWSAPFFDLKARLPIDLPLL